VSLMDGQLVTKQEMQEAIRAAKAEVIGEVRRMITEVLAEEKRELLESFSAYQQATRLRMNATEASLSILDSGLSRPASHHGTVRFGFLGEDAEGSPPAGRTAERRLGAVLTSGEEF